MLRRKASAKPKNDQPPSPPQERLRPIRKAPMPPKLMQPEPLPPELIPKKKSVNDRLAKYRNAPGPQVEENNCTCERQNYQIKCVICYFTFFGRIVEKCEAHPTTGYLMDALYCPKCKAPFKYLIKC